MLNTVVLPSKITWANFFEKVSGRPALPGLLFSRIRKPDRKKNRSESISDRLVPIGFDVGFNG